jgi:2C-methyl-D-erythritol 2,4-cyclodiphosphate synthase
MQKIIDPLAGAHRDHDGALHYHVEDKELRFIDNEDVLRAQYEKLKSAAEVWDVDAEDEDAFRLAML